MAESKPMPPAGSDADVFLSASEEEGAPPQEATPELLAALVKQVEFYFSDANLPTDKKLLKQIRKDPDGYVPVKLFANFRKVRALSKDVGIITEALRSATLLQLSDDAKRVKRIVPVPEYDIADIQKRTIVVENLPGNPSPTIESVTEAFRMYGRVKLVRICSRESKGKLPSWLTSSCQSMTGQQHAYVEFEEEEGAVLAAAALAAEGDASDGTLQVRRLLNCIVEQRERRAGAGSSYGGSSVGMGASRKGSRDVSPVGSRASSRRNSGGGVGSTYGSNGGASTWGSSSSGGAAPEVFLPHQAYQHHSYGGAYEHNAGSRRSSGGGYMPANAPPQPPPPRRRSCDSATPSELAPTAASDSPAGSVSAQMARLNIYRPPAKRTSDGYNSSGSTGGAPMPQRSCGGSFTGTSSGSNGGAIPAPASPVALPPPPPPPPRAAPAASSPPLPSRNASSGGGKPPAHPPSTLATNALAEAIAAAQAERRASEAGAKAAIASEAPAAVAAPAAAVAAALAPLARPAPKFCLDLAVRGRATAAPAAESASSPRQPAAAVKAPTSSGAAMAPPAAAAASLPRNTQMVANVEDFINNILSRPASRPTPTPATQAPAATGTRKTNTTAAAPKQSQRKAEPVDAAAAVAGILASTLRRPVSSAASTASSACVSPAPAKTTPEAPTASPVVFITALAPGETEEAIPFADLDLEHAVTVHVHRYPAGAEKAPKAEAQPVPPVTAFSSTTVSSNVSSAASSPREYDGVSRFGIQARAAAASVVRAHAQPQHAPQQLQAAGKRATRRDYAQWAAATPEFRAEAASKYGPAAVDASTMIITGGLSRCSAGGVATSPASPMAAFAAVPSSISDGGAVVASPAPAHSPAPHGPAWHVAKGPDGSRGFAGRRVLAA